MSAPEKRKRAWPFFLVAIVLLGVALAGLEAPFNGVAAMGCVGAFIAGGARKLRDSDPETAKHVTRAGIPGGGF